MIQVTVQTIGLLKSLIGQGELAVRLPDGSTVADLLATMATGYGPQVAQHMVDPGDAAVHPPLRVMVNGRDIGVLGGRRAALANGDVILMLTPIAGG